MDVLKEYQLKDLIRKECSNDDILNYKYNSVEEIENGFENILKEHSKVLLILGGE